MQHMAKNSNTLPEAISKRFPDLTEAQFRLLCFCAYFGEYPGSTWVMEKYDAKYGLRKGRTASDYAVLKKNGYIYENTNKVIPSQYFDIVLPMMKEYPDWVIDFETFGRYREETKEYLWKVSKCINMRDLNAARALSYPKRGNAWEYFAPMVFRTDCGPVISLLPEDAKGNLLKSILENSIAFDSLTEELLGKVRNVAETWMIEPTDITDQIDCYRYFLTGILPPEKASGIRETCWSLGARAVDLLYRDQLSESLEMFSTAVQLNAPYESANCFRSPILTWFYTVCLVRCCRKLRSHKAREALDRMMGDSRFKFESSHSPSRMLATYVGSQEKKVPWYVYCEMKALLRENEDLSVRHLGHIVSRYFRVTDTDLAELGFDAAAAPSLPILHNEIAHLIPTTSSAKDALCTQFGAPGALAKMPRKESWEMILSELNGQVRQNREEEEMERRIIYFLDGKWINAVMEQSRPAGSEDEWGHDRLLSRSTLVDAGYDFMDMTDLRLARALGRKVIDKPDIEVAIPILAGSDRIFTGQHYHHPYTPLKVEEEAPFVAFSGKDGFIEVTSNVGRFSDGSIRPSTIVGRDGGYVCVKTNPVQRDVLQNLLDVGRFPATATPVIRSTIDSLDGIIEVRSNLGSAAVIPTMRGSTRLALRISPDKNDKNLYLMDIQAAPCEEGSLRCEPGQGSEDVYDDTGEQPQFIKRDLQKEYDNYMDFRDIAENLFNLEFRSPTQCELWTSESMLKILEWAYENRDRAFVEWPEGRPLRFRGEAKASDVDVTVSSGIDWFSVEGELTIGKDKYDLEKILAAMRNASPEGYVKLGDKDYIRMTETLRRHLIALDEMLNERHGKERVVPVYRVGQLAQVLGEDGGINSTMDEGFTNLLDRMQAAYDSTPEVPPDLNAKLRDYQREGYVWMKRLDAWGAGACLADDMGLGKTLQSLAFMLSKAPEGPSLVVAPKSVIPNWDIEAAKFTPTLRVKVLNNETRRKECIEQAGPGDLILATYGVLGTESELLSSREWNVVCLDEAHQIKNRNTRMSAAAMGLKAGSRIILTGTPIQNHLGELWNLFQFINPGLLGQWNDFKARYMGSAPLDEENRQFLKDLVQPFILRRTKEEVLEELPEKMIYEQMVELSPEEIQLYEAMRKKVEDRLNEKGKKNKGEKPKVEYFAELTNLRLSACSMSLVHDEWKGGSSKTEALKGILEELSGNEGNRILIFSQFTSYLTQVKAMLDKAGMRYLYLDGQTELDERAELVQQFQNGDCPIFLVSLKA